ncbi:nucleotide sugar dehydrogenase [SAR86 cluster bacterium]|nr:nucleotide sugar dehydrogenase [SAR86 cluster bacterium]|tara:strand:+ start:31629 stop:32804 length:1176 start_codon:yes stop_codon:yes gene_type:complete
MNIKSIAIFGAGYVGSSLGILLSQFYEITFYEKDQEKIDLINNKNVFLKDFNINDLKNKELQFKAKSIFEGVLEHDLFILAVPTDYDNETNNFDTEIVENVILEISKVTIESPILIKSTVPVGFTEKARKKFNNKNIIFSPEFLREANAMKDNLYPSRIIIGDEINSCKNIASIFTKIALNEPNVIYMSSSEAEAVKLFANTYLAMRVAFFNELDTFSLIKTLDVKKIINGICADQRIGNYYNNPSFGYGGYCLPKDSKQLLSSYQDVPQNLIQAVVESNQTRKKFIVDQILLENKDNIGVYKLDMKKGSSNSRSAAILDIIDMLLIANKRILIFDKKPVDVFREKKNISFTTKMDEFLNKSEIIIANRGDNFLNKLEKRVIFTRDIFNEN